MVFRRYDELWMPMISDAMTDNGPPMILPPVDIEWVWFCHTLNPVRFRLLIYLALNATEYIISIQL